MNKLVGVLSNQGKYEQADEMHRKVLGLREAVLGNEHPSHTDEHKQPGGCAEGSGQVRGGGRDASTSSRAELDGAG